MRLMATVLALSLATFATSCGSRTRNEAPKDEGWHVCQTPRLKGRGDAPVAELYGRWEGMGADEAVLYGLLLSPNKKALLVKTVILGGRTEWIRFAWDVGTNGLLCNIDEPVRMDWTSDFTAGLYRMGSPTSRVSALVARDGAARSHFCTFVRSEALSQDRERNWMLLDFWLTNGCPSSPEMTELLTSKP
jgi:hypothetical protein